MEIKTILVMGSGTMGNGIAHVCALAGYEVMLRDTSMDLVQKGIRMIDKNLDRAVQKGKMSTDEKAAVLKRITPVTAIDVAKNADLLVEAVFEDVELKKRIFREMDAIMPEHAILASNTSSQSITDIAAATKRPDKVIGMHFFNPVPVMKLLEIIRGIMTSDETYAITRDIGIKLGKTPVEIKDYPGFATTRLIMIMINEAIFAYWEGLGTAEAIDTAMKLGMNHPMGPLELADLIGLDICLNAMRRLYTGFNDTKYRPCPLLVKMVEAGMFGRKTGKGFYTYETAK